MLDQALIWAVKKLPEPKNSRLSAKLIRVLTRISEDNADGKSARAALIVFLIRTVSAVIAFGLQIFLARWLGGTQYGVFVLVWATAAVIAGLSCFGLQTAVIRFITEYRSKKDKANLRGILLAAPLISVASSIVFALLGLLILHWYGDAITQNYGTPFYVVLFCLPLLALGDIQDGIARSFDMPLTALGPSFIMRPIGILLAMLIAYLVGFPPTAVTAIQAAIIAAFVATITQSFMLWRRALNIVELELPARKSTEKYKFQYRYWITVALPVFMAGGFYNLLTNIDVMFVGYFLTPQKVGIYFAAIKTLALVHFVHFAIRAATAHHFSRYFSDNDFVGLSNYARRVTQWTFWPTLALALIMVLAGKYLLALFGSEFSQGQSLLIILAVGIIIRSAIGPAESLLSMTGHQNVSVLVLAITLICNIILNITLIPEFGVTGAAIATTASMIIETFALYVVTKRYLGIQMSVFGAANTNVEQQQ